MLLKCSQHALIARQLAERLVERTELIVAEGARRQRYAMRLLDHRLENSGMRVTLIDG